MYNDAQYPKRSLMAWGCRAGALLLIALSAPLGWAEGAPVLSDKSDQELTELTARWSDLNPSERRVLLAEVRRRMQVRRASQIVQGAAPRARINLPPNARVRVQRRYGRIVRQPDGSVIVQERVVGQIEPGDVDASGANGAQVVADGRPPEQAPTGVRGRITFGFGFERRARGQEPDQRDAEPTPADP